MPTPSESRLTSGPSDAHEEIVGGPTSDTRAQYTAQPTSRFEALPLEIRQRILRFAAGPCPTPIRYDILKAIAMGVPQPQLGPQLTEAERQAFQDLTTLSLISRSCRDAMPFVRAQYLKPPMRLHDFEAFLDSDNATVTALDLDLDIPCTGPTDGYYCEEHTRRWMLAFERLPGHIRFITFQYDPASHSCIAAMFCSRMAVWRTRAKVLYEHIWRPL